MFSAIGHPVIELHRVGFGPVVLDDLSKASWRYLTDDEIRALRTAVGMNVEE